MTMIHRQYAPRTSRLSSSNKSRGFTAMEVAMVATVIAILALIVMPIFRNRVNDAKIAAARGDLTSLMKAEMLAQADTGHYYRLEDLDNVQDNLPATPPVGGVTIEIPPFYYLSGDELNTAAPGIDTTCPMGLNLSAWRQLARTFRGPYATFTRTDTYGNLKVSADYLFRTGPSDYAAIRNLDSGNALVQDNLYDSNDNRVPVDPWGNPYLFFPATRSSAYRFSAIYSMGPDGLPGSAGTANKTNCTREAGLLGTGDDLKVEF